MAGNVVFRTRDEGMTWEVISPDLTHNMTDKMAVAGSPWLPEYFGQEIFSTIHRLEESPHETGRALGRQRRRPCAPDAQRR